MNTYYVWESSTSRTMGPASADPTSQEPDAKVIHTFYAKDFDCALVYYDMWTDKQTAKWSDMDHRVGQVILALIVSIICVILAIL